MIKGKLIAVFIILVLALSLVSASFFNPPFPPKFPDKFPPHPPKHPKFAPFHFDRLPGFHDFPLPPPRPRPGFPIW